MQDLTDHEYIGMSRSMPWTNLNSDAVSKNIFVNSY